MITAAIYVIVFYNRGHSVPREVTLKYTELRELRKLDATALEGA
jgi:hypothetical protein